MLQTAIFDAVVIGDAKLAGKLAKTALISQQDPEQLIVEAIIPAMEEVGNRFECNEYFIPELLICARASRFALEILTPAIKSKSVKKKGVVMTGVIQGDLHDIGIQIIGLLLEGHGFEIVHLGVDVCKERFAKKAGECNPNIIAISCANTWSQKALEECVTFLNQVGFRGKVMIGGAFVTPETAKEFGCAYAKNAVEAIKLAREMVPLD